MDSDDSTHSDDSQDSTPHTCDLCHKPLENNGNGIETFCEQCIANPPTHCPDCHREMTSLWCICKLPTHCPDCKTKLKQFPLGSRFTSGSTYCDQCHPLDLCPQCHEWNGYFDSGLCAQCQPKEPCSKCQQPKSAKCSGLEHDLEGDGRGLNVCGVCDMYPWRNKMVPLCEDCRLNLCLKCLDPLGSCSKCGTKQCDECDSPNCDLCKCECGNCIEPQCAHSLQLCEHCTFKCGLCHRTICQEHHTTHQCKICNVPVCEAHFSVDHDQCFQCAQLPVTEIPICI